jgi:hypothetical protein
MPPESAGPQSVEDLEVYKCMPLSDSKFGASYDIQLLRCLGLKVSITYVGGPCLKLVKPC